MQDGPFCEQAECLASGEDIIRVTCPVCEEPVFCSEECRDQKRGLVEHLSGGLCTAKQTFTPRSVLERMASSLRASEDALSMLRSKQAACPREALVLDLLDMENACAILNSGAQKPALIIARLCHLSPIGTLDESLRQRYLSIRAERGPDEGLLVVRTTRQGSIVLPAF